MSHTTSLAKAREDFGTDGHVATPAMLERDEDGFKVVHDGTHDLGVNLRTKVRYRHTPPLGCDCVAFTFRGKQFGLLLTLVFDISKAHSRLSLLRRDWGFQASRPVALQVGIGLNTVGTYGIG